jgi:hypothetical protein
MEAERTLGRDSVAMTTPLGSRVVRTSRLAEGREGLKESLPFLKKFLVVSS